MLIYTSDDHIVSVVVNYQIIPKKVTLHLSSGKVDKFIQFRSGSASVEEKCGAFSRTNCA